MAKQILKNPVITVNGVNLSGWFREVSIESSRDEVDVTSFGATHKEILAGLGSASMTGDVFQDFAAGAIDQTLWPLSTSDTPFTVSVKPTNAAVSTTNPLYSMSALLLEYNPISGAVGEALTSPVNFVNASQTGLTRATA